MKPKPPEETQACTLAEMALTLAALDSDEHAKEHAIMALAFAGLRRAEISGLKWEDIDYRNSLLRIRRSAWGGVAGERAKNRASRRVVNFGTEVLESLKRWQGLSTGKNEKGEEKNVNGFVFENAFHGPLELGLYSQRIDAPQIREARPYMARSALREEISSHRDARLRQA